MAKLIGKFVTVQVDNSAGTLTAITSDVSEVTLPSEFDEVEVTGYSDAAKNYLSGLQEFSIDVNGFFNPAATTGSHTVLSGIVGNLAATRTVTIDIGQNAAPATGDPEITGEFYCTKYDVGPDLAGAITFAATFKRAAGTAITWGTKT